jgi:hypothetical protein
MHFTPTSSSWLNLVERWFGEITNKWIRRGTHRSVKELANSITDWVKVWNEEPRPYVWHKSADEILESSVDISREVVSQDTSCSDIFNVELSRSRLTRRDRTIRPGISTRVRTPKW